MTHSSSFDIKTADDFFCKIVIPQYNDFKANNNSSRHALLATIVSYHLYEWVHPGSKFSVNHFKSTYPSLTPMADAFDLARNITNGTKHYKNNCKTRTQTGYSSAFSDGFARPLNIEAPDGSEKSADIFLRELVDFWKAQKDAGAF